MKNPNESSTTTKKRLLSTPLCENKKTRDLPKLQECQACGFRIDSSTGKSRIQILYSEWRLVLLCWKCLSRVESSQICSYCFKESVKDFFTCCECKRSVHRKCFLKYKNAPPWSYSCINSCSSLDLSVCVDCWLPKSMLKKKGCFRSSSFEKSNSRVLNAGGHSARSLEIMVEDPNCTSEKTIVLALMATMPVGRKPVVPKRPNENVGNGSGSVVKKHGDGGNDKKVVTDDTELAFKLHRAMNSSPRISKNFRAVNSNFSSDSRIWECNDDLVVKGSDSGDPSVSCELEVGVNKKVNEDRGRSVLDHLVYVKDEDVAVRLKEGEESCSNILVKSSGDENSMNFESRSCHYNQYDCIKCKPEVCNGKPDRCLLKYRKRNSNSKPLREGKSKTPNERFPHQSQPLAAELSLNCSTESRTLSNGSLQPCTFPLQAPTFVSGFSPDDS